MREQESEKLQKIGNVLLEIPKGGQKKQSQGFGNIRVIGKPIELPETATQLEKQVNQIY